MFTKFLPLWLPIAVGLALPSVAQEAQPAPKRIVWRTSVYDAFVEAVESNRVMVLVFVSNPAFVNPEGGNLSNNLMPELDELEMHELADNAVFAIAQFDHRLFRVTDEFADRIFRRLKLTILPTISTIAPRTDVLEELHRLEGLFKAKDIVADLKQIFAARAAEQSANAIIELPVQAAPMQVERFELNPYEPAVR